MHRIPHRFVAAGLSAAVLFAPAGAQDTTLTIDQSQSNWTYSGTSSLGPIVGVPSNSFQVTGTIDILLTGGGSPLSMAELTGSMAMAVPDLSAQVPNPIPFLPPLASIDLTNVVISFTSPPFPVGPGGVVMPTVTPVIVSGMADVDVPLFPNQMIDLAGEEGPPTMVMGTLTHDCSTITFEVPTIDIMVDVADPTTGLSASLTALGSVRADFDCPPALTGSPGTISLAAGGTHTLELDTCVKNSFEFFLLLGTAAGTAPGLPAGAFILPLNPDAYFNLSLTGANNPPFTNTFGVLDAQGRATSLVTLPPGLNPSLAGLTLHHAFLTLDLTPNVTSVSNAEPVQLVP